MLWSHCSDLCLGAGEDETVRRLLIHAHMAVESAKWTDPHTKANALLQAHFSRTNLTGDLQADQRIVVPLATRLLQVSRLQRCCVPAHISMAWIGWTFTRKETIPRASFRAYCIKATCNPVIYSDCLLRKTLLREGVLAFIEFQTLQTLTPIVVLHKYPYNQIESICPFACLLGCIQLHHLLRCLRYHFVGALL